MRIAREGTLDSRALVWAAVVASVILFTSSLATGQQLSRFEVFGGYSYLRFDGPSIGFADYSNLNGWKLDGAYNLGESFSVVASVSGHYGSKVSAYDYMVGPRYSYRWERSRVFGEGLFGKAQNSVSIVQPTRGGFESVGWAFAGGGGYERDISSRFTFRVVEVDYLRTHTFNTTQSDVRVSTGLVVHLGHTDRKPRL
jgi:hypothetical protein